MNLHLSHFYKMLLLVALIFITFFTQKTVTLIVGNQFYSCSSNYRTLYDLSRHSPVPFTSFQSPGRIQNQIIREGMTIHLKNDSHVP